MANIETAIKKESPLKGVMGNASSGPIRYTLAANPSAADTFQFEELAIGVRVQDAIVSCSDVDTHATPTASLRVYISDGTTEIDLIAKAGTPSTIPQGGGVARLDQQEGCGYVVPSAGFYLYVDFVATAATFAAGVLSAGVTVSPHLAQGV